MESDFTQLYAWLGLRPDCTLDEFKHAYRKRVAELHPDRQSPDAKHRPHAVLPLSELTSLYATATRFHRQHGRLPGASPRTRGALSPSGNGKSMTYAPRVDTNTRERGEDPAATRQRTTYAAWAVILILILILVVEVSIPSQEGRPEASPVSQETRSER